MPLGDWVPDGDCMAARFGCNAAKPPERIAGDDSDRIIVGGTVRYEGTGCLGGQIAKGAFGTEVLPEVGTVPYDGALREPLGFLQTVGKPASCPLKLASESREGSVRRKCWERSNSVFL